MEERERKKPSRTAVRNYLAGSRDSLLSVGELAGLEQDLDLHVLSCSLSCDAFTRRLLADGLQTLALYLATRPADEHVGWTVSIHDPALNLFFGGSAGEASVVGRAFQGDVRERADNVFICEWTRPFGEPHLSSVAVEGVDIFSMVEQYFRRSEQKHARYFHDQGRGALLLALPEADRGWIESASAAEVFSLPRRADTKLLEERPLTFRCGCDQGRIAGVLAGAYGFDFSALFGEETSVEVECPRCAARYTLTRREYEAALRA